MSELSEVDRQRRYAANLQGEIDSASLYRTLSQSEKNPQLAEVYGRLAAVEEAHAEYWQRQLKSLGVRAPMLQPGFRTRALAWLARRFGPSFVLPTINTLEQLDGGAYDAQPEAVAGGLPAAERSHARVIEALAAPMPGGLTGATLARLEGRHRGIGGNALRAAVLGANDGLVSNLSLVVGVAGADLAPRVILVTGLAGLLAGSCSMALGEWLSVNTARESAQRQIDAEAAELDQLPEEEQQELTLIYQAKGVPEELAKTLAERLIGDKKTALDTLTREELGIDPNELGGSAWVAGGTSFLLFALGALFPVAPYFLLSGTPALIGAIAASGVALLLIGGGTALYTGRGVWFSAVRQLLIGLAAACVTYGIGRLIGTALPV